MPKLVAFLPCSKVIAEQGSNVISIHDLLEEVHILVPKDSPPLPEKSFAPMPWMIFTTWTKEEGDDGEFESWSELFSDKGEKLIETGIGKFTMTTYRQRQLDHIVGFPIWRPGRCVLKRLFRKVGKQESKVVSVFEIDVVHVNELPGIK